MQPDIRQKSTDFSIRIVELLRYLQDEGKAFPLAERLLVCSVGVEANMRLSDLYSGKEKAAKTLQAQACAVECDFLLEIMEKTSYLTELQSKPIRADCRSINEGIVSMQNAKKGQ